jgi:hypothetical protein
MSFYAPVCGSITPNIGGSITAINDSWPSTRPLNLKKQFTVENSVLKQ